MAAVSAAVVAAVVDCGQPATKPAQSLLAAEGRGAELGKRSVNTARGQLEGLRQFESPASSSKLRYDGGDDVGIGRWPRAYSGCRLYGGRHRDFERV
ncbi:MAG: hypothetical protein DME96_01655 [Verrucomicrobia bacterium]|nr:MAG: hypothetical protein DME96_01655 [Verrucomicrobiota bacterium]